MPADLVERKLIGLFWYRSWIIFFFLFSRGHHCGASYSLHAVDPHHVVRWVILLLVDNFHTNSHNKLTRTYVTEREPKRGGNAIIYRLSCDVIMAATVATDEKTNR